VTVAQFRAFTIAIGKEGDYVRALRGLLNHPVTNVTWHGAIAYCNWLTQALRASPAAPEPLKGLLHQGWRITLPGEAEWEKAARGATARVFAWGDDYDPDKANVSDTRLGDTSPVGCFARGATPEDLQDMTGNVWEWTRSHYKPYPYVFKDGREDLKAGDNILRVLRGGSFNLVARFARCAYRDWGNPSGRSGDNGFRVVAVPFNSAL
jgi:formylglycine-generating enzyme required for sulfatase activity